MLHVGGPIRKQVPKKRGLFRELLDRFECFFFFFLGGGVGYDHGTLSMPKTLVFTAFLLLYTTCCTRTFDVSVTRRTVTRLMPTVCRHDARTTNNCHY